MEAVIEIDELAIKRSETKKQVFESYVMVVMNMDQRAYDRDNTIMLNLTYSNFEEYFDTNKWMFLITFSKVEKLFAAIIRNFAKSQISFMTREITEQVHLGVFDELFYEVIEDNIVELMSIVKTKYPRIYTEIENLNENGLSL